MSRPSDPPNDPMAKLDTVRCDTRALDVGALRAIHAAYVTGVERGGASGASEPETGGHSAKDRRRGDRRDTTLEVDFSPAVRERRTRSAKAQRVARIVTIASLFVAALLAVWVVASMRRAPPGVAPVGAPGRTPPGAVPAPGGP